MKEKKTKKTKKEIRGEGDRDNRGKSDSFKKREGEGAEGGGVSDAFMNTQV